MIDARQLHGWLGVRDYFHQWVKRRAEEYGLEDGTDFCTSVCKTGGCSRTDYLLTIDMAKELSTVERTERGQLVLPLGEGIGFGPVSALADPIAHTL